MIGLMYRTAGMVVGVSTALKRELFRKRSTATKMQRRQSADGSHPDDHARPSPSMSVKQSSSHKHGIDQRMPSVKPARINVNATAGLLRRAQVEQGEQKMPTTPHQQGADLQHGGHKSDMDAADNAAGSSRATGNLQPDFSSSTCNQARNDSAASDCSSTFPSTPTSASADNSAANDTTRSSHASASASYIQDTSFADSQDAASHPAAACQEPHEGKRLFVPIRLAGRVTGTVVGNIVGNFAKFRSKMAAKMVPACFAPSHTRSDGGGGAPTGGSQLVRVAGQEKVFKLAMQSPGVFPAKTSPMNRADLCYERGCAAVRLKLWPEALEHFKAGIHFNPGNKLLIYKLHINVGWSYFRVGQAAMAIVKCSCAIDMEQEMEWKAWQPWYGRAWAWRYIGNETMASQDFAQTSARGCPFSDCRLTSGKPDAIVHSRVLALHGNLADPSFNESKTAAKAAARILRLKCHPDKFPASQQHVAHVLFCHVSDALATYLSEQ